MKTNKNGVKLLAAVMVLAIALAGVVIVSDDGNSDAAAQTIEIDGNNASALNTAISNAKEGYILSAKSDITIDAKVTINKPLTIDLGSNKLIIKNTLEVTGTEGKPIQVTIKNGSDVKDKTMLDTYRENGSIVVSYATLNLEMNSGNSFNLATGGMKISLSNSTLNFVGDHSVQALNIVANKSTINTNNVNTTFSAYFTLVDSDVKAGKLGIYAANIDEDSSITAKSIGVYTRSIAPTDNTSLGGTDGASYTLRTIANDGTITADSLVWGLLGEGYNNSTDTGKTAIGFGTYTISGTGTTSTNVTLVKNPSKVNNANDTPAFVLGNGQVFSGTISYDDSSAVLSKIKAGSANLTFNAGSIEVSGEVTKATSADGTITLNGTGKIKGTIDEGVTVIVAETAIIDVDTGLTNKGDLQIKGTMNNLEKITGTGSVEYSKTIIDGITYQVFKTVQGTTEILYGISCGDVIYSGYEIDKYDVKVLAVAITAEWTVTSTYELEDISKVTSKPGDKYLNAGKYSEAIKVQVSFSKDTKSIVSNNKIDLIIQQKEPTVDVKVGDKTTGPIAINQYTNPYTNSDIKYYYNGNWYTLDAESPVSISMKIVKNETTDVLTDISKITKGDYTLTITFDASKDGNYKSTTTNISLTVVDTPAESELIIDEVPADMDLLGKTVDQLQYDVGFGKITGESSPYTIKVSGKLIYVDEYKGFSSEEDEQSGFYLAFMINNERITEKSTLKIVGNKTLNVEGKAINDSYVLLLGDVITEDVNSGLTEFTIYFDLDGAEGSMYKETAYKLVLDVDEMDLMIKYIDSENTDVFTKEVELGKFIQVPNGAGTEKYFVGWEDEVGNTHAALSMLKITNDLDANSDKIIVMTAKYEGSTPTPTPGPETPAEKIDVLINATSTGISVAVIALDGGDIVEGDVTVTFSILVPIEGLEGIYLPSTFTMTVHVGAGSSTSAYGTIDFSEIKGDFHSIYGLKASYQGVNTGFMQCSYVATA